MLQKYKYMEHIRPFGGYFFRGFLSANSRFLGTVADFGNGAGNGCGNYFS